MLKYGPSLKWLLVGLLGTGLILAAIVFTPVIQTVPESLSSQDGNARVTFSADDTSVLMGSECIDVSWSTENIQSVELNGNGVAGNGTRSSCSDSPELKVKFRSGTTTSLTIDKQVRMDYLVFRVLLVLMLFLFVSAVFVAGMHLTARRGRRFGLSTASKPNTTVKPQSRSLTILLVLVVIILVGTWIRGVYLSRSVRHDEAWTYVDFASHSVAYIITNYNIPNNQIFHTLLVHFSTEIFGFELWSMRLPAFFAGVLMIAATFAVGRRFYNLEVGLAAAAFVAGASWLIEYSDNARGYTIITLDFLVLILLASSLCHHATRRRWLLFALLSALGLFTIPIMIYPLGVVYLWLFVSIALNKQPQKRWSLLKGLVATVLLTGIVTALLYLPAFLHIRNAQPGQVDFSNTEQMPSSFFFTQYQSVFQLVWENISRDLATWVMVLLVVGVVIALLFHRRVSGYRVNLVLVALIWLPIIIFVQMAESYDRLWLFMQPLLLIVAAAGLVYLLHMVVGRWMHNTVSIAATLAIAVALISSVGVMQSNSVELVDNSGRALGTEDVIQTVAQRNNDHEIVLCAGHCKEVQLYGLMYGLHVEPISDTFRSADEPFYVIAVDSEQTPELDQIFDLLKLPQKRFISADLILNRQDAFLFRLIPKPAA